MSPRRSPPRSASSLPWDRLYPTLDLHGATADEARPRTARWLAEQQATGARTVRVITGKGLHSVGPPVLRGEIEALLGTLRGSLVASYTTESGGGAFRIELRRPKAPRAAPNRLRPPVHRTASGPDAELRRRAEEALWELGVSPTPELIEAEMRRLRQEGASGGR
jgi:hypothetical protein